MKYIYITSDSSVAAYLVSCGLDYIMVDLEIEGKFERQGHLNTVISCHTLSDVSTISNVTSGTNTKLLVRVNPFSSNSVVEVESVIRCGADSLMLPMFRKVDEVISFLNIVDNRVPVILLLETSSALARLRQIVTLPYSFDIHLGLNDLHLDLKLNFMFELFSGGIADHFASLCRSTGRCFGLGGIGRPLVRNLLPAEDILKYHNFLGSSLCILSRDWRTSIDDQSFPFYFTKLTELESMVVNQDQINKIRSTIDNVTSVYFC